MSGRFSIPVNGLKEGLCSFDFEINKEFFDLFGESDIKNGDLRVSLESEKRISHIDLSIHIKGDVEVTCDRCLELFRYPVDCINRLVVKFGDEEVVDPDIISVSGNDAEIDLSHFFYEYIVLDMPIQRIHPIDENGDSGCDPVMIERLSEHSVYIENEDNNDPRWDVLNKLKNN